jgi:MFS transporter, FHS family, L-fucose permease
MAILGGAVLPPIMGKVADHLSRQALFIVPFIAYCYVAFFGLKGHKIGRNRQPAV